jgi:autotransporter-associated beta strand protein
MLHLTQSDLAPLRLLNTRLNVLALGLGLSLAAFEPSAHAANATWNGTTDGVWATGTNWSATPVPGTGNIATFDNAGNLNTILDLGTGVTINTILFDTANAAAYTIGAGGAGAQTLTLNANGAITLNNTVANDQLFNANLALGTANGSNTFTFTNDTTKLLTLAGSVSTTATTGTKAVTIAGSGNTTISGNITNGPGGTVAITKNGAGTLTLTGNNTASNALVVNAGLVILNSSTGFAFTGGSTVGQGLTINGGTVRIDGTNGNQLAHSQNGQIVTLAGGTFDLNGKSETVFGITGSSGVITNSNASQATLRTSSGFTYSSTIEDGVGGIKLDLDAVVTRTLSGLNTYSKGTSVLFGTLNINNGGNANASAIGTGLLALSNNVTLNNTSGSPVTLATNNAQTWGSSFSFGGTNDLNLGTGAITTFSSTRTVTTNGTATLTVGGVLSGSGGAGLTKAGVGTLALTNGASTYSGVTTISAGTLLVNNASGSATGSGAVVVNGGRFGGTGVVSGQVTVNAAGTLAPGASIESLGTGSITFNGGTFEFELNTTAATADLIYGGDGSTLTLTGTPTLTLIDLDSNAALSLGTKLTLISYDGAWNNGTFTSYSDDSTFSFAGNTWQINYNDTTSGSNFGTEANASGTAFVTLTVVPEPGTLVLAGLGGLLMLHRRKATGIQGAR